jgi:hypothetical protein
MKINQRLALSAAVIAFSVLAFSHRVEAQAIPSVPIGVLSAHPTVVQTGTKPKLSWSILYPSTVGDVATITLPGTLTVTDQIFVGIQIIGTEVSTGATPEVPYNTDLRISINDSSYTQLFYGDQSDVDPGDFLYVKKLQPGDTIDLGGRYVNSDNTWSPFYTTQSGNKQVIALVDGDTPLTTFPLYQSSTLESYLKPYLDASGKVDIGPMNVLVMMELGQTDHSKTSFDYQDQVVLVTFSTKNPSNNGHGNNLDGVDSSNPGAGSGGPNGSVDPSGGYDDER